MSTASPHDENESPRHPSSDETDVVVDEEEARDLGVFVRQYIEVDNEIAVRKGDVKPITYRIRELSVKKRQLATVVATIMGRHDIDTIEPDLDGVEVGKITRVHTRRAKPTVASVRKAVLESLLGGDKERMRQVETAALALDKPAVATLRRSKHK